MKTKLDLLEEYITAIFGNSTHKRYLGHSKRVRAYARSIGEAEGAALDVLLPAALLHDVGYTVDGSFQGHVAKSMILARGELSAVGFDAEAADRIVHVLGSHHPEPGAPLESLEEKVLYDADNMEIIGAFGCLRWVGTFPETTADLVGTLSLFEGVVAKCVTARGSLFFTATARSIGDDVVRATLEYYSKVKQYIAQFDEGAARPVPMPFGRSER